MISLVTITDGTKLDYLERCIKSARSVISEVVLVYQGTDKQTAIRLGALSDFLYIATPKGNADPDRNFAYHLAQGDWVLALDDDEWLPEETQKYIARIVYSPVDVVWFEFTNLVDGVEIQEILGSDPHPRLWRRRDGLIMWPDKAHTFPQISSLNQIFTHKKVIHDRSWPDILTRHRQRRQVVDEQNRNVELQFVQAVQRKLQLQFPNEPKYKENL